MRTLIFALALIFTTVSTCYAEQIPKAAPGDSRVRFVPYDASNVVRVKGYFGYQTFVLFSEGEFITDIAAGDRDGWSIGVIQAKNGFFIKPTGHKPETNLTVITTKYHYIFDLVMGNAKKEKPYYMVRFTYPGDEQAQRADESERDLVEQILNSQQDGRELNWNYWWDGSDAVKPIAAWDNGTFTYFRFAPGREFPSIFVMDPENQERESTVNIHVEGDTIVVHRTAEGFVLRIGNKVAGVWNHSYTPIGVELPGTISPNVERTVKKK